MFDTDGPVASDIAWLWWFMLVLGTVAFGIFVVALVIGLRRGRSRGGDATGDDATGDDDAPSPRSLRRWVLGGGVVMPTILLLAVLVATVVTMRATSADSPADALRVEVIGHRWWYEIRYPDHGVETANELHLPVDRTVELHLSSVDVIHSFWVPPLAGKLDMLPDTTNTLVLRATETGEHRSQCAEFCGLQHAKMRFLTIVEPPEEFESWLAASAADASAPTGPRGTRGHELFMAHCASCHTVRGTAAQGTAGPDLTHMSDRRTIAAATVDRTAESLREWIADPDQIKEGVLMPPVDLAAEEMDALLAYLDGLR